ncbi:MAG TPA: toll/interleukin-1 receptor domain-containing protein [Gemmataceae bacterium]|nr:toll/interleukin-1 receptor domain-containing protein [Gemmataceae bacterium]
MGEATFPQPVNEVVSTLADIFRHQRRAEVVELLESAHAQFDQTEFDNWNGGTYTWALRLQVPVQIFASVESRLPSIEKEIAAKLSYFDRQYPNDPLGEVTVSPLVAGAAPYGQRMVASDREVRHLWFDGRFRLFLSHVSKHKVAVSNLKDALWIYGVDAFVAHEDIEPSLEWQREIELGLRSMHALAALITPDFHVSNWTDQELGWALGRGVLVVPLRLGADPYGLVGKIQGVRGTFEQPDALAASVASTLLANPQTHGEMRRALINAFRESSSSEIAKLLCRLLVGVTDVTDEEKAVLWEACAENTQVAKAVGVADAIYTAFGAPPRLKSSEVHDEIPF